MLDWLAAQTLCSADKTFFWFKGQGYTFDQVNQLTGIWATRLKELGIAQGDVVAVCLKNCPEYVYLCFALMRVGATFLPLNSRLTSTEIEYQLNKTKTELLITSYDFQEVFSKLCASIKLQFVEDDFEEGLESLSGSELDLGRQFCIMFTSGTTGQPKGVCLSLKNFFYSANSSAYRLGVQTDDNWLCAMPLYHVGGLSIVLRSCLYGTTFTLHERFDFVEVARTLADEEQAITLASLVPTMLYRLLQKNDFEASSSLRLILLGGAAASPSLLQDARVAGLTVVTTYGLTEACSQVATTHPAEDAGSSVGKPLMFTEVKIVDDKGFKLSAGEVGEILVRSETVMLGYFDDEISTRESLQDGWLRSGDLGYVDAKGQLFVEARRSDLIISGGENIYPGEVESVLESHSSVNKVAVVGLPDAEWGERVVAVIVLEQSASIDRLNLTLERLCKVELAPYKCPKQYFFVEELPQTASGKVRRSALKQGLLAQSG